MANIIIRELPKTTSIQVLGHIFNGLADVNNAVGTNCRVNREPWNKEPKSPVDGIYVICVYEPYPCFDAEDFASENRDYKNFFFSTKPFTEQQIDRLSKLPYKCNYQMVCDTMPEWALPAVYYSGCGEKMIVATPE